MPDLTGDPSQDADVLVLVGCGDGDDFSTADFIDASFEASDEPGIATRGTESSRMRVLQITEDVEPEDVFAALCAEVASARARGLHALSDDH
jgi:hypothetical protein